MVIRKWLTFLGHPVLCPVFSGFAANCIIVIALLFFGGAWQLKLQLSSAQFLLFYSDSDAQL